MNRMRKCALIAIAAWATAVGLYLLRAAWLPPLASALVETSEPRLLDRAQAVLVPGADWVETPGAMQVAEHAASLVRQGRGQAIFMTCPDCRGRTGGAEEERRGGPAFLLGGVGAQQGKHDRRIGYPSRYYRCRDYRCLCDRALCSSS